MLGACLPGVPQHLLVGQELPEWQARAMQGYGRWIAVKSRSWKNGVDSDLYVT